MLDRLRPHLDRNALCLLLCGLAALYWELVLIRWLGTSVRIVAYYSNFVLMAAFFGLGAGALLARYDVQLRRLIFPAITLCILVSVFLSGVYHSNWSSEDYVWLGRPGGILIQGDLQAVATRMLPPWLILASLYALVTVIFAIFGQWIGTLFKTHRPLWAYSVEVFGSIVGILLFALMSAIAAPASVWIAVGCGLLLILTDRRVLDYVIAVACSAVLLVIVIPFSDAYRWSPYYRILSEPIFEIFDRETQSPLRFEREIGHALTVNNDYHQMILDLRERSEEHAFLREWRALYDLPYRDVDDLPPGPILIVGAGTGNDVSAALRNTDRRIYAVEIDPVIVDLGRRLHPEKPYENPRVNIVIDDARSFFQRTDEKFAMVVFGFLDSHTLLSSFSSLRLDNFVYTRESLEKVREILLPNGQVHLTFAANTKWIFQRLNDLLESAFAMPVRAVDAGGSGYPNGIVFSTVNVPGAQVLDRSEKWLPRDDWPFLYLERPTIPLHYLLFITICLVLGCLALLLLPKSERKIRFPYFFLGAGFFLIETSNVISLSLLYGSTWNVNVLVFTGILVLVLLGNLTVHFVPRPRLNLYMTFLVANIAIAIVTPTAALLELPEIARAVAAVLVFLGPVYFASLIFASLIKDEQNLYQAYGSNILGAVVGGVCEYLSLMLGFKFILGLTLLFYLFVYLLLTKSRSAVVVPAPRPTI